MDNVEGQPCDDPCEHLTEAQAEQPRLRRGIERAEQQPVQTADEQILPKGTGYLTDLGMTGPVHSVIGVKPEQSIANFRGELTSRYEVAPGPCRLAGAVFTIDAKTGRCTAAERVMLRD